MWYMESQRASKCSFYCIAKKTAANSCVPQPKCGVWQKAKKQQQTAQYPTGLSSVMPTPNENERRSL